MAEEDQWPCEKRIFNWVVWPKITLRESLFCGKLDPTTQSDASRKNSGKEMSIAWNHSTMRNSGAKSMDSKIHGKNARRNLKRERCARRDSWDLAKDAYKLKKEGQIYVLLSCRSLGFAGTLFQQARTGASVQMQSKQDLCSGGLETLRRSRNAHNGGNGQWKIADERGSTSFCTRSSSLRDCAFSRGHTCRSIPWKTLRRARFFIRAGQWSKATSYQR